MLATLHRRLAFCGLLILFIGVGGAQAAGPVIGTVESLRGTATVRSSDSAEAPLAPHADLHQGETVRTGAQSRLKLLLRDGSSLTLGAGTELELDSLAMAPGSISLFVQLSGFVRAAIEPLRPGTQFMLRTPSMIAAVRGTEWIQNYEAGRTEIVVTRGQVQASSPLGAGSDRVALRPGEGVAFVLPTSGARSVMAARKGKGIVNHSPVVHWERSKIEMFEAATSEP
jgi:hypothetical protein